MFDQHTLAIIYVSLMGLAVLLYAILDGYDLGVGILLPLNNQQEADTMVASIGPFWDANETWLVLAIGLLLIAFPQAHSLILKELYLPAVVMLIGLILRGVAFDFRAKASFSHKPSWDKAFKFGSLLAAASQGFMLGLFVTGFDQGITGYGFAVLSALGVTAAYCFIGSTWLVMKTEGRLQKRSIKHSKITLVATFVGVGLVSVVNFSFNPTIYEKWFNWPDSIFLVPIPIVCTLLFALTYIYLSHLEDKPEQFPAMPFIMAALIFIFSFAGLGYSFYPFIVPQHLTIWQTVAAPESLNFLLYGTVIVIPTIIGYTIFSYRVFWGKVQALRYY